MKNVMMIFVSLLVTRRVSLAEREMVTLPKHQVHPRILMLFVLFNL